ncbi:hypothetical protein H109_00069 [Trichophyton interdigitale MR816]|uniref:Uncharacterized protein n=1 Tax=Trichophyton interdigitale (strain MR816) TaxID=1215338 RepID=A0A059JK52_TRIIM|nr:hypothetical protein H109_00069 [Trichophyton interdigitale MR816]
MERPKITPWKELSQLVSVRDQFYRKSDDGEDRRAKACSLVWVWKLRGNLPHAVEATALLTDAILHDDPDKNSIFSIRAAYSLAFCRQVSHPLNCTCLHGPKQSMYQKAMAVGIPASFVELRHEATHRDLPSLVVLRDAATRSMNWLWEFYWDKIDDGSRCICEPSLEGEPELSDDEKSETLLHSLTFLMRPLIDYIYVTAGIDGHRNRRKKQPEVKESAIQNIVALCRKEKLAGAQLVEILIDRDLGHLSSCGYGKDDTGADEEADALFVVWDDVLKELSRSYEPFLTLLVDRMTAVLVSADTDTFLDVEEWGDLVGETYEEELFQWLEHILTDDAWASLRNQYLVSTHARAICLESGSADGFWASEISDILPGAYIPRKSESDTPSNAPGPSIDQNPDIAVLQNYGWDFGQPISCRPIGASIDP